MIPSINPSTGISKNIQYRLDKNSYGEVIGISYGNCYYEILTRGSSSGYYSRILENGFTTGFINIENLFTFQDTEHFLPIIMLMCYSETYDENTF